MFRDLETDRLLLKCISPADRDFIFKQFSDEDVSRYLLDAEPMREPSEADELIDFYTSPEPRDRCRWIIVPKASGESVGTCGFHRWDVEKGFAEIGYDLQKDFRGQGYMTEAVRAILAFARDKMRLVRVDAHIYPDNAGSVRLAERLGFRFDGETVVYMFRNADYTHRVYSLAL